MTPCTGHAQRRRGGPTPREEVAHARCPDTDERLHEVSTRDGDERHAGLAEQGLAAAGLAEEQQPLRRRGASASYFVGSRR